MRTRHLDLRRLASAGLAIAFAAAPAAAHGGQEHAGIGANDVAIAVLMVSALALFATGWRRLPKRRTGARSVAGWRSGLFLAALLFLALALLPPFDRLADARFSAHMAQHLVLLVVAPPMLAASQAELVMLQAFPVPMRRRLGRFVAAVPGAKFLSRHGSAVGFVCLTSVAVLWFWHLPSNYEWARRSEPVHDAEHLLFLGAELAFWRVILFSGTPRLSRAGAALVLAMMGLQGGLLAAVITLATRPLYGSYGSGATSLADQALGGVMMWVLAGTVYLGAFAFMFALALAPRRRRSPSVPVEFTPIRTAR